MCCRPNSTPANVFLDQKKGLHDGSHKAFEFINEIFLFINIRNIVCFNNDMMLAMVANIHTF